MDTTKKSASGDDKYTKNDLNMQCATILGENYEADSRYNDPTTL